MKCLYSYVYLTKQNLASILKFRFTTQETDQQQAPFEIHKAKHNKNQNNELRSKTIESMATKAKTSNASQQQKRVQQRVYAKKHTIPNILSTPIRMQHLLEFAKMNVEINKHFIEGTKDCLDQKYGRSRRTRGFVQQSCAKTQT